MKTSTPLLSLKRMLCVLLIVLIGLLSAPGLVLAGPEGQDAAQQGEVVVNGSFEDNDDTKPLIPDSWTPKNLSGTDGIACTNASEGSCSLTITGNGTSKKVIQKITTPGTSGDYTLSFDTRGQKVSGSGSYLVKLKFFFTNGITKTYQIKITNTGTFGWTH